MRPIHALFMLSLLLLPSFATGQSLSITERRYFQRTGFYTFVGESTFRGVPVSVFIAGHSGSGGVINTQIAWAFRSKIEVVSRKFVASTEWQVYFDCNTAQIAYLSFEDIDEYQRIIRHGQGALWSAVPTESTPSLLGAELFQRLCGRDAKPTIVALGETSRPPVNYVFPERSDPPRFIERSPQNHPGPPPRAESPDGGIKPPDSIPGGARSGTGFFINNSGVLITNHHVVAGCSRLAVADSTGVLNPAIKIAGDPNLDLAALRINQKTVGMPLHRGALDIGEAILVFGYPLSSLLSSGGAATTGIVSALSGVGDDNTRIQISAPIQPGNSGGSVVNYSGAVIGVVVSKLDAMRMARIIGDVPQNVNFAINLNSLKAFLTKNRIESSSTVASQPMETTALVSRVRSRTRKVLCDF